MVTMTSFGRIGLSFFGYKSYRADEIGRHCWDLIHGYNTCGDIVAGTAKPFPWL